MFTLNINDETLENIYKTKFNQDDQNFITYIKESIQKNQVQNDIEDTGHQIGEIVLLKDTKELALVIKDQNRSKEVVSLQITSDDQNDKLLKIDPSNLESGRLEDESFVKYDNQFTLNATDIEDQLAMVNKDFMEAVKYLATQS